MPPRRLWRYQVAKATGGLIAAGIFAGWLLVHWSNVAMRLLAATLLGVTAWATAWSILDDAARARGRQVAIRPGELILTTPGSRRLVSLPDVAWAQWRHDSASDAGLWLYDSKGEVLAHLDENILADEAEAREFLGWARKRAELPFNVQWPGA